MADFTNRLIVKVVGLNDLQRLNQIAQRISVNTNGASSSLTRMATTTNRTQRAVKNFNRTTATSANQVGRFSRVVTFIDGPLGGFASRTNTARLLLSDLGISSGLAASALTAMAVTAFAVTAGLIALTVSSRNLIDEQTKTARSIGITHSELVSLQLAASEVAGTTDAQLNSALTRMVRTLNDVNLETSTAGKNLNLIGVNAAEIQRLNPAQQFATLANALKGVTSESTRAAIAQQIFGRNGRQLSLLLAEGSGAITRYRNSAAGLGLTLRNDLREAIEESNDAVGRVGRAFRGIGNTLAAVSAGPLTTLAEGFEGIVGGLGRVIRRIFDLQSAAEEVRDTRNAFGSLRREVNDLGKALQGQGGIFNTYASALGSVVDATSRAEQQTTQLLRSAPAEAGAFLRSVNVAIRSLTRQRVAVEEGTVQFRDFTTLIRRLTIVKGRLEIQVQKNIESQKELNTVVGLAPVEFERARVSIDKLDRALKQVSGEIDRSSLRTLGTELDRSEFSQAIELIQRQSTVRQAALRRRVIDTTATQALVTRARQGGVQAEITLVENQLSRELQFNKRIGQLILDEKTRQANQIVNIKTDQLMKERQAETQFAQFRLGLDLAGETNSFAREELQLRESLERRETTLQQYRDNGLISEMQYQSALFQIRQNNSDATARLDEQRQNIALSTTAGFFGNLASLASTYGEKGIASQKAFATAENAINTYLSATKAFQSLAGIPIVGPVLGGIAAAGAIAGGIANQRRINAIGKNGSVSGGTSSSTTRVSAFGGGGTAGSVGLRRIGSGGAATTGAASQRGTINNNQSITINPAAGTTDQQVAEIGERLVPLISEISARGDQQTATSIMDEFRINGSMDAS